MEIFVFNCNECVKLRSNLGNYKKYIEGTI